MGLSIVNPLPDPQQAINSLRRELEEAEKRADAAEVEARAERRKREAMERGIASLRSTLRPLHEGLSMIFGEMEAMGIQDSPARASAQTPDRVSAVWESWKQRLGEGCAKVIDALLLHREMNTQQLAIATGYHRTTVPTYIHKLNKAGLLNKNGGRFSLKEL